MPRTVISLEPEDKEWLDKQARVERVPMTEIVRRALRRYRLEAGPPPEPDLDPLLKQTRGLWRGREPLAFQTRLREEWDDRA